MIRNYRESRYRTGTKSRLPLVCPVNIAFLCVVKVQTLLSQDLNVSRCLDISECILRLRAGLDSLYCVMIQQDADDRKGIKRRQGEERVR